MYAYIYKPVFAQIAMLNLQTESAQAQRTTILINKSDWEFIKAKRLKPTNLLRAKIAELKKRDAGEGIDWEAATEKLRAKLERICEAMAGSLTSEQYRKIMQA